MFFTEKRRFLILVICYICAVIIGTGFFHRISFAQENNDVSAERRNRSVYARPGYNVIMISLGNVGTEHMSLYGYSRKTTPLLDTWAKGALVFEDFFSPASWTLPVATSLFTSLQPYSHKVNYRYHHNILDKRIKTLAEILKDSGYRTAAFTGGLDYKFSFGHMRGFDDYAKNADFTSLSVTLKQAKEWLEKNKDQKFFLFVHGYDAHCPFTPPKPFLGTFSSREGKNITVDNTLCLRGYEDSKNGIVIGYYFKDINSKKVILTKDDIDYLRDLYDEEVLLEDNLVGKFLEYIQEQFSRDTVIIVLAEHGEMFARHGRFGRAGTVRGNLYDDVIHIPLAIRLPNGEGQRISGLGQVIDLMPTLLEILRISGPKYMQGKSLLSLCMDRRPVNDYVYAGGLYWTANFYNFISISESIRDQRWKLICEKSKIFNLLNHKKSVKGKFLSERIKDPKVSKEILSLEKKEIWREEAKISYEDIDEKESYELYDLKSDPGENNNMIGQRIDVFERLKKDLDLWRGRMLKFGSDNTSADQFSQEALKNIRQHGYW